MTGRGPVRRGTIRRGNVCRGSVLGEVSVGEMSSRGNVLEPFKDDFRIYPNTFVDIVNLVEGNISKQDIKFRKAIPIEKRVAIALVATGNWRRISKYW